MLIFCGWNSTSTQAQGTQTTFGQNAVQFKDFTWQFYETENFTTYFYSGGQSLGKFAVQIAETDLKEIEEMLDYRITRPMNIMIFNNVSDFNQRNLGFGNDQLYNTGGRTRIVGNKIFIYFDGNHKDFRRQIREGIARTLVSNMVFGGNLQEIVQNAVLLNLPSWFIEGLVSYLGEKWNSDYDNRLRDGILNGDFEKFNKLTGEDARFAGHALWYYIAENYGLSNIPNLLYLIRVNRSLENGFLFVLGSSVNQTIIEWQKYFREKFEKENSSRVKPKEEDKIAKKYKKKFDYHNLKISPTGKYFAYVTNELGRYKVHVQEFEKKRAKTAKRGGFKTRVIEFDQSYPILTWSPTGNNLAIIYERRAKTKLLLYDVEKGKKEETREIARFQKILDASFTRDSRKVVISAMNKGQSDIFVYYIPNARLEQITNDFYDDLNPAFVRFGERDGILFSSNRESKTIKTEALADILPTGNFDLFFYDYSSKSDELIQVTNTSTADEFSPQQYDDNHFAFLSDYNGINNRFAGYIDSVFSHKDKLVYFKDSLSVNPEFEIDSFQAQGLVDSVVLQDVYIDTAYIFPISNYATNIIEQDISYRARKSVEVFLENGQPTFYVHPLIKDLTPANSISLENTDFRNFTDLVEKTEKASESKDVLDSIPTMEQIANLIDSLEQQETDHQNEESSYFFQSQFPPLPKSESASDKGEALDLDINPNASKNDNLRGDSKFQKSKIRPYRTKFATDYVLTQLDNSLFINKYENFTAGAGQFDQPDLSGLFTVSISDLFEDYVFVGGFRIPTSFSGTEYFLSFENRKKRLDQGILYYRSANSQTYLVEGNFNPVAAKVKTNVAQYSLKYPIDVLRSLRGYLTYRNDKITFQATDVVSLGLPNYKEDWLSAKLEYVFDNTYEIQTNILDGTRFKFFYELHKGFEVNFSDGFDVSFNKGFLSVLGADARHYLKIHRNIIWANRFAAATSFGSSKLVYYLGGVDSWIASKFNTDTEIDFEEGYAFQTLATNMRGFDQNIRNGNTYAVINSELRVPIFSYIFNKPIRSEIIKNFQFVGFFDVGSAWKGINPFNDENQFNTVNLPDPAVTVEVNYYRNPIVAGYGFGARTLLFGYFLRVDVAWGLDSGTVTDPVWYFSLTTDF